MKSNEDIKAAVESMRKRLVDLTSRNKLLNYDVNRPSVVRFVDAPLQTVFDKLESKASYPIHPLPEPQRADYVVEKDKVSRPRELEWAQDQGISIRYDNAISSQTHGRIKLQTLLYEDAYTSRLQRIANFGRLAIEETGANMLYMVLGFLEYPDSIDSEKMFLAPTISVPVSLKKVVQNGKIRFSAMHTGEEIEPNVALEEKLKRDFNLVLPVFDSDEGDLDAYFTKVAKIIKNTPDLRLVPQVAIGTITNYADIVLSRDLESDLWDQGSQSMLYSHPIIRSIVAGESGTNITNVDSSGDTSSQSLGKNPIPLVFDADSSQERAIREVVQHGRNMVVAGPPGTGKSQTIANMIGALIHEGKRVLFIADKLAALEVVKGRLASAGLEPFVLALHGNKVNKREVFGSLDERLSLKQRQQRSFNEHVRNRDEHAATLQNYVDELHSRGRARFGTSPFDLIWEHELHAQQIQGPVPNVVLTAEETSKLPTEIAAKDVLMELQRSYLAVRSLGPDSILWKFRLNVTSEDDVEDVVELINSLIRSSKQTNDSAFVRSNRDVGRDSSEIAKKRQELEALKLIASRITDETAYRLIHVCIMDGRTAEMVDMALRSIEHMVVQYRQALDKAESLATLTTTIAITDQDLQFLQRAMQQYPAEQTVGDFLTLHDWLGTSLEQLKKSVQRFTELAEPLEIVAPAGKRSFKTTYELVSLLAHTPDALSTLPETFLQLVTSQQALDSIARVASAYCEAHASLAGIVKINTIPELDKLWHYANTFHKNDWLTRIRGGGRAFVEHQLQMMLLGPMTTHTDTEEILRLMIAYKNADQALKKVSSEYGFSLVSSSGVQGATAIANCCMWLSAVQRSLPPSMETNNQALHSARANPKQYRSIAITALNQLQQVKQLLSHLANRVGGVPSDEELTDLDALLARLRDMRGELGDIYANLVQRAPSHTRLEAVSVAIQHRLSAQVIVDAAKSKSVLRDMLGPLYQDVNTDIALGDQVSLVLRVIQQNESWVSVQDKIRGMQSIRELNTGIAELEDDIKLSDATEQKIRRLEQYVRIDPNTMISGRTVSASLSDKIGLYSQVLQHVEDLVPFSMYQASRDRALKLGLQVFIDELEAGRLERANIVDVFRRARTRGLLRRITEEPGFKLSRVTNLAEVQSAYRESDQYVVQHQGAVIAQHLIATADPPEGTSGSRVDDKSEMQLIRYLIKQTKPRLPLRKLFAKAGNAVQELKPCFMMSPHAVAQYLVPGKLEFDVVIIDEASQVPPEEALGAIARGRQLVVVGDNQQLPPTSFFKKYGIDGDDDEELAVETASILSLAESHLRHQCRLTWHYRSRHQSLISFSNTHFYNGNLIVFPSPYRQVRNLGIYGVYVADAEYSNTMNAAEATQCVNTVCQLMKETPTKSIGVVTLNKKQAELIQRLFDEVQSKNEAVRSYVSKWEESGHPFFIKNLENVQGDERDCIVIGTTFGPAGKERKVAQNFGPISKTGGEKRLNVLFSRARERMTLITSLKPEDIVISPTTPRGTQILRSYLEYALHQVHDDIKIDDTNELSPFVQSITAFLQDHGYVCHHHYGVSSYRLEIAIEHPKLKGQFVAAIESDGDSYADARTPRDRDRIRHEVMTDIGWRGKLIRVWSIDWYRNRKQEQQRILSQLQMIVDSAPTRQRHDEPRWLEVGVRALPQIQHHDTKAVHSALLDGQHHGSVDESERSSVRRINDESPVTASSGMTSASDIADSIHDESAKRKIGYGDVFQYVDVTAPEAILTMQIVKGDRDDIDAGIYSIAKRPIAQLFYEHHVGDEVTLRVQTPGKPPRQFRIVAILDKPT